MTDSILLLEPKDSAFFPYFVSVQWGVGHHYFYGPVMTQLEVAQDRVKAILRSSKTVRSPKRTVRLLQVRETHVQPYGELR